MENLKVLFSPERTLYTVKGSSTDSSFSDRQFRMFWGSVTVKSVELVEVLVLLVLSTLMKTLGILASLYTLLPQKRHGLSDSMMVPPQ